MLTSICGLIWTLYSISISQWEAWEEVTKLDIVAEGLVLLLSWSWLFLAPYMRVTPKINMSLFLGFSFIYFARSNGVTLKLAKQTILRAIVDDNDEKSC